MARLIVFIVVILGLVSITFLDNYKSLPRVAEAFNFSVFKKEREEKLRILAKIEKLKLDKFKPKNEEKVKKPTFTVNLSTDSLKRGHKLYSKCIVCHGKLGEGKKSQNSPKIGGQYSWYIASQIKAMKSKVRVNTVMNPYIKKLSNQDIKDLSDYISC